MEGGMQEGWREVAEVGGDVGARSQGFSFGGGGGYPAEECECFSLLHCGVINHGCRRAVVWCD